MNIEGERKHIRGRLFSARRFWPLSEHSKNATRPRWLVTAKVWLLAFEGLLLYKLDTGSPRDATLFEGFE
eukprot:4957330-Amphidinium_carterae.1